MNNILSCHGTITHWLCWEISNPPTLFGLPSSLGPTGCFHCCRIRCCMSQLEGRKQTSLSWEIWPLWTRPHSALRGANSDGSERPLPDVKLGLFLLFGFAIPAEDTIAVATLVVVGGTSLGTVIASRAVGSIDHSHNMASTWLDGNREYDTINQARWRNQYSSTKGAPFFISQATILLENCITIQYTLWKYTGECILGQIESSGNEQSIHWDSRYLVGEMSELTASWGVTHILWELRCYQLNSYGFQQEWKTPVSKIHYGRNSTESTVGL